MLSFIESIFFVHNFLLYGSNKFIHLLPSQYNIEKMNITQLSKLIAKETGEPAYKINEILNVTVKVIREQIIKAKIVKLKSLLTIFIDVAPAENYYNINTKSLQTLPRRFVLKIQPSKILKDEIKAKKTYQ